MRHFPSYNLDYMMRAGRRDFDGEEGVDVGSCFKRT
jgi:hypothetical protein